jgi:hypothetical protein
VTGVEKAGLFINGRYQRVGRYDIPLTKSMTRITKVKKCIADISTPDTTYA